jgi:hypothetical protein
MITLRILEALRYPAAAVNAAPPACGSWIFQLD